MLFDTHIKGRMGSPNEAQAVTAMNRFGLGARQGDLRAAAGDPRGFLIEELLIANIALISGGGHLPGPAALQAFYLDQQQKRAERAKMAAMGQVGQSGASSGEAPVITSPAPPLSFT